MEDPSAPRPALPEVLGKYRVRALLGEGSMGMVFLAHDPALERDVAIKVMASPSVRDPKLRERFEREAKVVAKLHHPNIVTVHDLGCDERGSPFIAMELLEGSDLQSLAQSKTLSLGEKLAIIVQVCRGLGHAHQNGIVHRDIKPANIFVLEDGTAKIMDFGVARWIQTQRTQAGLIVGTAGYISPEQLRGQPADGRADLFSLGVVLFEILTNQVLFSGENIETIFFKTLSQETPSLLARDGQELPALQAVVQPALTKDVDTRYRTAGEMESALLRFLDSHRPLLGETIPFATRERGSSPPARTRKTNPNAPTRMVRVPPTAVRPRPRRKKSYRALLGAAALLVATGALTLYSLFLEKPVTSSSPPAPKPEPVAARTSEPPEPKPSVEASSPILETQPLAPSPPTEPIRPKAQPPPPPPDPPSPLRNFVESRTEFTATDSVESEKEILGFEAEAGFDVGETIDPFLPAQVLIELSPADAKPGQPYQVRVSLFNEGYRPIRIENLELVGRFDGRTSGKGQPIPAVTSEVPPRATALVHEVAGTWKESWNEGQIEVTVRLVDGGTLTKRLSWRPSPR